MCMNFNIFKELFGKKENNNPTVVNENKPEEDTNPVTEPQVTGSSKPEAQPDYSDVNFYVLLDNGHAKSTAGKRSPLLDNGERFYEYEFNRDVVARIAKGLDKLGIKYHVLVPELEKDISLTTRANRANSYCNKYGAKNCFFISVHSNAYGNGDKWGSPGKWSVWTTEGKTKSDDYAEVLYRVAEEKLAKYGFGCRDGKVQGNGNPGPDYEENFTVIYKTWCPAVLTENLFYTNKKECEFLMTEVGRQVIADIHVEGIRRIIENL